MQLPEGLGEYRARQCGKRYRFEHGMQLSEGLEERHARRFGKRWSVILNKEFSCLKGWRNTTLDSGGIREPVASFYLVSFLSFSGGL